MKAIHTLIAGAVVLALAAPLASAQDASKKKLYCWDEGGRKVCGDALPAHAVDSWPPPRSAAR